MVLGRLKSRDQPALGSLLKAVFLTGGDPGKSEERCAGAGRMSVEAPEVRRVRSRGLDEVTGAEYRGIRADDTRVAEDFWR
jgi:hypothetical protein